MTFLPIVVREMRVAARSRSLYRARFWTAAASVAFGAYLMFVYRSLPAVGGNGRLIFGSLSYIGFYYCIGLARNTADCISEEKREGTLGLLFLTDLKGYDVAFGKLFANSLKSFYGLLATVPVVCCVWVLGGVTLLELGRMVLALLNIFFFAHVAGLLISTYSRDSRRAMGATMLLLLFYLAGIPALVSWLEYERFPGTAGIIELFDPGYAFRESSVIGTHSGGYWSSVVLVNLNAWLFLALASSRLPRCWQDKPRDQNTAWRARFRQWCFGPPEVREALRRRLLDINPFLWLASRNRLGQVAVWAVLGLILCGFVFLVAEFGWADSISWCILSMLISHTVLKFWVVSDVCLQLEEQRHSGALEFLLSCTPLSVEEIVRGQWLALRRRFLGPVAAVLAFNLILIAVSQTAVTGNDPGEKAGFPAFVFAAMLMLLADIWAIGWMGMWRAMAAKRPRQAAGQTILGLMFLPWWLFFMLAAVFSQTSFESFAMALTMWFVLGIVTDAVFASVAKKNLLEKFRELAAVQSEDLLGLLGRLGRALGRMAR